MFTSMSYEQYIWLFQDIFVLPILIVLIMTFQSYKKVSWFKD